MNDWVDLGLSLGLHQPILDRIAKENTNDVKGCMRAMLLAWLKWEDNVDTPQFGRPSWKRLIDAIRLDNKQLADKIQKSAPWKQYS